MNIERFFELAEKANDTELVWLATTFSALPIDDMVIFHRLYGKKVVAIIAEWGRQGLRHREVIESVAESMRTRLEA